MPAFLDDERQHAFKIVSHVECTKLQSVDALFCDPSVPLKVKLRIGTKLVGQPIEFNCERCLIAKEVESIGPERVLAPKFEACGSVFQHIPKQPLRGSHVLAQGSCPFGIQRNPSTSFAGTRPLEIEGRK
jgi:hypothetical protein